MATSYYLRILTVISRNTFYKIKYNKSPTEHRMNHFLQLWSAKAGLEIFYEEDKSTQKGRWTKIELN